MKKHLSPDRLKHLAWLDLDTEEGKEYWNAMNLMGKYAAANHACIHKHVTNNLGAWSYLILKTITTFWKKHIMVKTLSSTEKVQRLQEKTF